MLSSAWKIKVPDHLPDMLPHVSSITRSRIEKTFENLIKLCDYLNENNIPFCSRFAPELEPGVYMKIHVDNSTRTFIITEISPVESNS